MRRVAQEDASSVTADTGSHDTQQARSDDQGPRLVGLHMIVSAAALVLGGILAAIASLQLVLPDLGSGMAFLSYGRLAPASRILLVDGFATIGLLGLAYHAISKVTGSPLQRAPFALASLATLALGAVAGALGVLFGLNSGIAGLAPPIWARALLVVGALLGTLVVTGTAKDNGDQLGTTAWYLAAAPIVLTLGGIVGLVPASDGIAGTLQTSFAAGSAQAFLVLGTVGILYFVVTSLTGTDPNDAGNLGALGFWSAVLVSLFLSGWGQIYSPSPDWFETINVAITLGALVPLLVIVTDFGLMLKGRIPAIANRAALRYVVVAGLSGSLAVVASILLTWRATSSVIAYSTWVSGARVLLLLGAVAFSVFAAQRLMAGGGGKLTTVHFSLSTLGLVGMAVGLLAGGTAVALSWAAGPAVQAYSNAGVAWKVTADTSEPFLWIAALSAVVYAVAQLLFAARITKQSDTVNGETPDVNEYELDFATAARSVTWRRLVTGVAMVWILAGVVAVVIPTLDDTDRDPTILADTARTYESGTPEFNGRNLYISEGCAECHTQIVRAVGTDVGLGPVSVAGDYANESPALLGTERFGPDLMHFASRDTLDKVILGARLTDPRVVVPFSTMPSYSYLSDDDVQALISYLSTLE